MFAFHLARFRTLAIRYPTAVFYDADTYDESQRKLESFDDEDSDDEPIWSQWETPQPRSVPSVGGYPYRHPHTGFMMIDTFSKAMQIYGLEMSQGVPEETARRWFNVAWTLPGIPPIPNRP